LLTRLTTAMDITAATLFVLMLLWLQHIRGRELLVRLGYYARVAGPCYALFLLLDRTYQYYRFGSFFNTYLAVYAEQQKKLDPSLPSDFPWRPPLHPGVIGPMLPPEKSISLCALLMRRARS